MSRLCRFATKLLVPALERHEAPFRAERDGRGMRVLSSSRAIATVRPGRLTLTNVVVPVCRSRTNTSHVPLVSVATRSLAPLENATKRPSALSRGAPNALPLSVPAWLTLTSVVVPSAGRARTRPAPLVSVATRSLASLGNATKRPSALSGRSAESHCRCPSPPG